jgi:hypothetical protein
VAPQLIITLAKFTEGKLFRKGVTPKESTCLDECFALIIGGKIACQRQEPIKPVLDVFNNHMVLSQKL